MTVLDRFRMSESLSEEKDVLKGLVKLFNKDDFFVFMDSGFPLFQRAEETKRKEYIGRRQAGDVWYKARFDFLVFA